MTMRFRPRAALLAPLLVASLLAGCQSATDYSSEYADEEVVEGPPNLVSGILGAVGMTQTRGDDINYAPRAPLVVPPSTTALVAPESPRSLEASADWPVDPDLEARRQRNAAALRELGIDPEASAAAAPSELLGTRVPPPTDEQLVAARRQRQYNDDPARTLMPSQLSTPQGFTSATGNPYQGGQAGLTTPPPGYFVPAPGGPPIVEEEDSGWFW